MRTLNVTGLPVKVDYSKPFMQWLKDLGFDFSYDGDTITDFFEKMFPVVGQGVKEAKVSLIYLREFTFEQALAKIRKQRLVPAKTENIIPFLREDLWDESTNFSVVAPGSIWTWPDGTSYIPSVYRHWESDRAHIGAYNIGDVSKLHLRFAAIEE